MLAIDNSAALNYCKDADNTLAASVAFSFSNASEYTSAPTVAFSGGGGTGAAGTAIITNGVVTGVTITNAGTGYTSDPTVAFSGGGGAGAAGTVVRSGSTVGSVIITNGGTGQAITFTDNTTYASGDSRANVNISVFDHFGHNAEVQIPSGSATAIVRLGTYSLNKVEGLNAIATVVSTKGKVKDGSVYNIATLLTTGNFVMEK